MEEESKYRISYDEFRRRTPRVYGGPRDPDDPDGEIEPATAFAVVEQPEPPPSPNTIEGLIAGIGRISAAAAHGDPIAKRRSRTMLWLLAVPVGVGVLIEVISRLHGG